VKVLNLPLTRHWRCCAGGYRHAADHAYDIAIQFDGDGQHCASEIEKLLEPLRSGRVDLVLGSRFLQPTGYRTPILRRVGISIFSIVLSTILRSRLTDTTSGFRAANKNVIAFFSRCYPEVYPEFEALVLMYKAGLRIAEVPVIMRERTAGQTSITALGSVYYMIKVLLAVFIDLLKKVR
jgi:hypothetical protein